MKHFPLQFMAPGLLRPYWQNPKRHSKRQVVALAAILKKYGFDQPIVVDADFVIIKGQGRYLSALHLNLKLVPVIVRGDLSADQVRAARIADNRVFELGEDLPDLVQSEIQDFVLAGGVGAEDVFDFMKPAPEKKQKTPANKVQVQVSDEPAGFTGTMLVCPSCDYTYWMQK